MNKTLRRSTSAFLAAMVAVIMSMNTATVEGAPISGTFDFKIDQNLIVLDSYANIANLEAAIAGGATGLENSLAAAKQNDMNLSSMWVPYTSILGMRDKPGLLLSNDASSNASITGFVIDISSGPNEFMPFTGGEFAEVSYASGEYTYIEMPSYNYWRVDNDLVPMNVGINAAGDKLSIEFGNGGIQPGKATTFKVCTAMGIHLEEFFDSDTEITVTYSDATDTASDSFTLDSIGIFNSSLMSQLNNGVDNQLHFRSMVMPYAQQGLVTGIIPEPSSLLLAISCVGCLSLRRRVMRS